MPSFPGLVSSGQPISSAWGNGIRNALIDTYGEIYAWAADVDANGNDLYDVGNIGIGTSTPSALLHIAGANVGGADAISGIALQRTYDTVGDCMDIVWESQSPGVRAGRLSVSASTGGESSFIFYAQTAAGDGYNNEVMRVQGNGFVGIGTATPDSRLHINGKFRQQTGVAGSQIVSNAVTLADEASAALESVVNGGNGTLIIGGSTDGGYVGIVAVRGAVNSVTLMSNPHSGLSNTNTDGFLCIFPDGDGTYTIRNRTGSSQTFVLLFIGF